MSFAYYDKAELVKSAKKGNVEKIAKCLQSKICKIDDKHEGKTALFSAVENGQIQAVKYLLQEGASPHIACGGGGLTPLHVAAQKGNVKIVRKLIKSGAEVDKTTNERVTPLILAIQNKQNGVIITLLDFNANIHHRDARGKSAINYAEGNQTFTRLLDDQEYKLSKQKSGKWIPSAVHDSVKADYVEVKVNVELTLRYKPPMILSYSSEDNYIKKVEKIAEAGKDRLSREIGLVQGQERVVNAKCKVKTKSYSETKVYSYSGLVVVAIILFVALLLKILLTDNDLANRAPYQRHMYDQSRAYRQGAYGHERDYKAHERERKDETYQDRRWP